MKTLYRAARVHTMGYPETGEWLLTDGRHVQRVGTGEPPQADRVVALPGATIVPGFIDSHVHLTPTGQSLDDEDVAATTSAQELLGIARRRRGDGRDPVIMSGFDETRWDRPLHPTLQELDAAGGEVPLVIFRADGHIALANSAAIAASGVEAEFGVEHDPEGEPTGRLTQQASAKLSRWATAALSDHQIQALQLKAAALAASRGVTSVHEMQMPHDSGLRDLQVFLGHRDRLPSTPFPSWPPWTCRWPSTTGSPPWGGTSRWTGPSGRGPRRSPFPMRTGRGTARRTTPMTSWRRSSRGDTRRASRWGCTPSGTAASSR